MQEENIFEKIKEYRNKDYKSNNTTHWFEKEIELVKNSGNKFKVNGFGICANDKFEKDEKGTFRYYLEFEIINPKGKKGDLVSIMMNPSDKTNPKNKKIDSTVTNVLRMAYVSEYSKVILLNSFPYINGNGNYSAKNLETYSNENKINRNFIKNFLKENIDKQDILLAWGGNVKNTIADYYDILKPYEEYNKIYVYNITSQKFPMHPSPFNQDKVNEILRNEKKLQKVSLVKKRQKIVVIANKNEV